MTWAWRETEGPMETILMNEKYIQIFNGYRGAYGVANIKNAYVDPDSGKLKLKPGDYRWNYEELTNDIYNDHLNGNQIYWDSAL